MQFVIYVHNTNILTYTCTHNHIRTTLGEAKEAQGTITATYTLPVPHAYSQLAEEIDLMKLLACCNKILPESEVMPFHKCGMAACCQITPGCCYTAYHNCMSNQMTLTDSSNLMPLSINSSVFSSANMYVLSCRSIRITRVQLLYTCSFASRSLLASFSSLASASAACSVVISLVSCSSLA